MRRVVLTEKPQVARDIASVMVNPIRGTGEWFEGPSWDGNYYYITWCNGHLLELYVPEADGPWDRAALPILPEKMKLRPVRTKEEKNLPPGKKPAARRRLEVIRDLFNAADEIVAATDAGREGQAIFDNVYRYIGVKKPTKRFWTMSLTDEAIKEAMEKMEDNESYHYRMLGYAAWERSYADWLVGINATRMFSLSVDLKNDVGKTTLLSHGRVQTLTLRMIGDRYEEHRNFKSEPYWYFRGRSEHGGVAIDWRSVSRYSDHDAAIEDEKRIRNTGIVFVESVMTERKTEEPPLLHDLASLQKMANSRYALSMEETLGALQSLYLKHLVSYPRTGSRFIPTDVFRKVPSLLSFLASDPDYGRYASSLLASGPLYERSVSDKETSDHHGLIITGQDPAKCRRPLSDIEMQVYDLVKSRFIEAFMPCCTADVTTVNLECEGVRFVAHGRRVISAGWKSIGRDEEFEMLSSDEIDDMEITTRPLPDLVDGMMLPLVSLELIEDRTRPKPYLTDATLLSAMENAGSGSDSKSVHSALKEIGIGTPATRSEIMKTLIERNYIRRDGKNILLTDVGLAVYRATRNMSLADIRVTAKWESALSDIVDGRGDLSLLENDMRDYARRVTSEMERVKEDETSMRSFTALQAICPKCGHVMRLGDKSAWCNNNTSDGCGFTIYRNQFGKDLSEETMRQLINEGRTPLLTGFPGKEGKTYDACLVMNPDGTVGREYPRTFKKRFFHDGRK